MEEQLISLEVAKLAKEKGGLIIVMNRIKILTNALNSIKSGHYIYMCNAIEHYLMPKDKVFKVFPEILKYKPVEKSKDSAWWYNDENGKQQRIKVLTELIQELNENFIKS